MCMGEYVTKQNYEKMKPWHTPNKISISALIKPVYSFIQEIAYKMSEIITSYCLLTTNASYFQKLWKYRVASRPTWLKVSWDPGATQVEFISLVRFHGTFVQQLKRESQTKEAHFY